MQETILWKRIDFPGHEICQLSKHDNGWELDGTAVFSYKNEPCKLNYLVITKQNWETESVKLNGKIGIQEVSLQVKNINNIWYINNKKFPEVEGCIDIDLGFSPSTNILPIKRLSIPIGGQKKLTAAWLHFPTLEFKPLTQIYKRESKQNYIYESRGGDFVRELSIRSSGFVQNYPGLWKFESAI